MQPVLIDFESRSRADLPTVGGRRYWEHPSTEALCVVWCDTRDNSVGVWRPGQPWPHVGRVLAAHNAHGFDRFGAERYGFQASDWIDTAWLARRSGLPGSLSALGAKDDDGSKYTKSLSSVRRPRHISASEWRDMSDDDRRFRGVLPAANLPRVVRYCASDVHILWQAWPELQRWVNVDAEAANADRAVNDRGIAFDSALARRLLAEDTRVCDEEINRAAKELGWTADRVLTVAQSPKQFCAATGAPNAQAETVTEMTHPLAMARCALASIARGKLLAGLARVHSDGRLRDTLRYYGAHTGRWSGSGMQLQNLPRIAVENVDALADQVLSGRQCTAREIAALVRATLTASPGRVLSAGDYSSIEARATAWAAEDTQALKVFRSSLDPYKVAAQAIFGRAYAAITSDQRQVGKVCELALGYQGGVGALEKMARLCRVDLAGLDVSALVRSWRELHAPVQRLWHASERAFRKVLIDKQGSIAVGPWSYAYDRGAVACLLPSGRPIVYRDAAIADGITYRGGPLYGGKLVENAVSGLCRDLLADALVRAESEGMCPVLTVHDEIVCDGEHDICALMAEAPVWSSGLPIEAKGWTGFRYRKG